MQHEGQREDLIRTATALVQRVELAVDGFPDLLVIGFRRDGAASLFLGEDPVYQFNARGELRRAFQAGKLVKAESGRLVELTRQRADKRVDMLRHELTDLQHDQFLSQLRQTLDKLYRYLPIRTWLDRRLNGSDNYPIRSLLPRLPTLVELTASTVFTSFRREAYRRSRFLSRG